MILQCLHLISAPLLKVLWFTVSSNSGFIPRDYHVLNLRAYCLLFTGKKPTFSDKVSCFSGLFLVLVLGFLHLVPTLQEVFGHSHVFSSALQPLAPVAR